MMKKITVSIWKTEEYTFPMTFGFVPTLAGYLHDDASSLPGIMILPGGGFSSVSPSEAEVVALKFYEMGYQTFVLTYTTNPCKKTPCGMQALHDIARAIRLLRKNRNKYYLSSQLFICGFSAGGHLCANLAVHFSEIKDINEELNTYSCRPDAVVLGYPVITLINQPYKKDFCELLGATTDEEIDFWCPEKHVTSNTPPCFIWHTQSDNLISVQNSYIFANTCHENHINYCLHIFSSGNHGMSTADSDWSCGNLGKPYTMLQAECLLAQAETTTDILSDQEIHELRIKIADNTTSSNPWLGAPNQEVAQWPYLVDQWIKSNIL